MTFGEFDPDKFVAVVFREGVISTLYGLPESGKTNIASVIMEMLISRGYDVYTIVHFFKKKNVGIAINKEMLPSGVNYLPVPAQLHVVDGLSDLLIGVLSTEQNVVILDEGGIFAKSKLATSKRVTILEEMAYIIRHFSSSLLIIAQSKASVCPDLRERLVQYEMRIRKMGVKGSSPRLFSIATGVPVMDDFTGEESVKFKVADGDEYRGIPLTRYPVDSKYTPHFDVLDIDLFEARKRLAKYDSIEVQEVGADIIRQMVTERQTKKGYVTTGKYAKKHGVTVQTVWHWCEKGMVECYKTDGGQYRVNESSPRPVF